MSERVMLGLGEFRFEIATAAYQKLSLSQSWRWPEQARINRDPALQFVGRNAADIDLDGVIYPSFHGDLDHIEVIREMADEGKPQQLVDGIGRVWGAWVITDMGDTRTVFADNGQPRKIEFRLKLKAYGEDDHQHEPLRRLVSPEPVATGADADMSGFSTPVDAGFSAGPGLNAAGLDIGGNASVDLAIQSMTTMEDAAQALPEITADMSLEHLTSGLKAATAMVGDVVKTVSGAAHEIAANISGAVAGIKASVLAAIPPEALQAVVDIQTAVGEVKQLQSDARNIGKAFNSGSWKGVLTQVAGLKALPKVKHDILQVDAVTRLASYASGSAARVLRDTEQTFTAVARLADRVDAVRSEVANTVGQVAGVAERFTALCDKAGACTNKVLEKFNV